MRARTLCCLLLLSALSAAWGCSSGAAGVALDAGAGDGNDSVGADAEVAGDRADGDAVEAAAEADRRTEEEAEVPDECPPGASCFGMPCLANPDCYSGYCVEHLGDMVCSRECVEDCPAGWSCEQAPGAGSDWLFVCVSQYPTLCRPCAADEDCKSKTGQAGKCVHYLGEGTFCAAACTGGGCPEGYACGPAQGLDDKETQACLAVDGKCACSAYSVAQGFSTPCWTSNDFGVCEGKRACAAGGLAVCDAADPKFEVCNAIDDDCNGAVDDGACDDANACTLDQCDPAAGCSHVPQDGTGCDDGDLCTVTDHCAEGVCVGTPIKCQDNNECTDDTCDGLQGCAFPPNEAACDDGDPCTVGDQCDDGKCVGVPLECQCLGDGDCAEYDDGNACNGTMFCDTTTQPWQCKVDPETVVACPEPQGPDAVCQEAQCSKQTGECLVVPAGQGVACDDGNGCTYGESCGQGSCGGGLPLNCNDGNPCTTESCDPAVGCVSSDNAKGCEDGNLCTMGDKCAGGKCMAGGPMDCGDGNPCTDEECNPLLGCVHTNNSADCDDLDPCTTQSKCSGGMCVGTGLKDCNDGNPCTDDACLPMLGCDHANNQNPCSDGDLCTLGDACVAGMCVGGSKAVCDDKNPCTDDLCDSKTGCKVVPNTKPCDDGNPCTTGDVCKASICTGTSAADCDDGNPCTKDVCLPGGGCQHDPADGVPCADSDACTLGDSCKGGACQPGAPLSCDDKNPCTNDACDPKSGCTHAADSAACDDLNQCTENDKCVAGACQPGTPKDCKDDNVCTTDYCVPAQGCVHSVNESPCNDGDVCTLNDQCSLGVCVSGGTLSCSDGNVCTDDSCDPKAGCKFTANAAACDDGNACTTGDHCAKGVCAASGMLSCGDDNLCTDDFCTPDAGCGHLPNVNPCNDGDACTTGDVCGGGLCKGTGTLACEDGKVCTDDSCDPKSGCVHGNNVLPCDDGNACTATDVCSGGACLGGAPPNCDDANVCTDDSCDPKSGCKHVNNTVACTDNSVCTENDKCANGSCVPGPAKNCDDGDACTTDSCDPAAGCKHVGSTCCGNGVIDPGEECDDGNKLDGDGCSSLCKLTVSAFKSYSYAGRMVYIFKSNSNTPISQYTSFCEGMGLKWFTPKSQADAQNLITYCYNIDSYHTWIITKNTTTAGTFGGYSVTVDSPSCVGYSSSGFSAIRKWGCSYCEPEDYGYTKCWDGHSYDWLVCEGGA